jgi:hypothetical protein
MRDENSGSGLIYFENSLLVRKSMERDSLMYTRAMDVNCNTFKTKRKWRSSTIKQADFVYTYCNNIVVSALATDSKETRLRRRSHMRSKTNMEINASSVNIYLLPFSTTTSGG